MAKSNELLGATKLSQSSSPYFDIKAILEEVSSNDVIASFLFSKATVACDLGTADSTDRVVGIESAVTADPWVLQRYSGIVQQNEKVVAVCHKNSDDVCWVSHANERTPWCFSDHPSPLTSTIHRSIGMQPQNQPHSSFIIISNAWLKDGRSILVASCCMIEPIIRHEKHILILRGCMQGKYPTSDDALEHIIVRQESSCSFCSLRESPECLCSEPMKRRLQPSLPSQTGRDAWSMYKWFFSIYDAGIRKYTAMIRDVHQQTWFPVCIAQHVKCFSDTQLGYQKALQYYASNWLSSMKVGVMNNDQSEQDQQQQDIQQAHDGLDIVLDLDLDPDNGEMLLRNHPVSIPDAHSCPTTLSPSLSSSDDKVHTWSPSSASAFGILCMRTNGDGPSGSLESSSNTTDFEMFAKYLEEVKRMRWTTTCRNQCRFCPQQFFTRKHDLKRHIKSIHLRRREHSCRLCSQTFIRRGHLEVHMRRYHDNGSSSSGRINGDPHGYDLGRGEQFLRVADRITKSEGGQSSKSPK